ncbi:MAG: helix-turn-helix domain-containing protein [Acidimicrobiales bacterium]|jgi:DNA-binding HxlR family transcriptional regulator|nr:helix-turn-helix domain-containing protein [Acidimicrobiales bacterium]
MAKRDYKQFCPMARALNVVGERWTLLIVRDPLMAQRRYNEIRRAMPGMASNLLAPRLAEMEEVGLIEKRRLAEPTPHDIYALTDRGRALEPIIVDLARFGFPYLGIPTDEEPMLDERVPLGLRAMMLDQEMPDDALTMRFALDEGDYLVTIASAGPRGRRLAPGNRVQVARLDGEGDASADVVIRGTMAAILWVRQAMMTIDEIEKQKLLTINGPADAVDAVRYLYRLSAVS